MHVVFILGHFSIFAISGHKHPYGIWIICDGFILCLTFVDLLLYPKLSGYMLEYHKQKNVTFPPSPLSFFEKKNTTTTQFRKEHTKKFILEK